MNATLAWERIGDSFFRTLEGPAMRWSIPITQRNIRAAPHGGAIAVWDREDVVVRRDTASTPGRSHELQLFGGNGSPLGRIALDFGLVVDVVIPENEIVVVITGRGQARHYTDFGLNFVQISFPSTVLSVRRLDTEYVAQLQANHFQIAVVTNTDSPEPKIRIANLETIEATAVSTWDVIPEDLDIGQPARIVIVSESGSVFVLDLNLTPRSQRIVKQDVPVGDIALTSDRSLIAFSSGSALKVFTTDFRDELYSGQPTAHSSVVPTGKDAFSLVTGDGQVEILTLRGAGGSSTVYFDDEEVALIPEVDGLRVLGPKSQSLLLPVPRAVADTFKIGSTAASAILYSCVDQLDAGSPRADQTVKLLGETKLSRAVDTCITAALAEIDPKLQKRLLRAAAFGKSELAAYDSTRYLESMKKLRVGNALRSLDKQPFFVTNDQLEALGLSYLLRRLESRRLSPTAVSIARLNHVPVEPIYIEWACWFILTNPELSDEELMLKLDEKMSTLTVYSHSKMALRALEQGRSRVALALLESEPVSGERVKLLLDMDMAQAALDQAVRSGNVYLVDYVLLILTEQLSFPQLMRLIGGNTLVVERQQALVQLPPGTKDKLHDFLYHMDLRTKSLQLEFDEQKREKDVLVKVKALHALSKKFSNQSKKLQLESHISEEWADLLTAQKQLEAEINKPLAGLSVSQTLSTLLSSQRLREAQKLKSKLGVSDRQFWWLRLRSLVSRRDWDGLWDFSQSKKSPIGYQPFFDACIEAGSFETAARFVAQISDASAEDKVRMYLKAHDESTAREIATRSRDSGLMRLAGIQP